MRHVFQSKQIKIRAKPLLSLELSEVISSWTQKGCRMWRTVSVVLLVLVSVWTLRAEPVDPEPVIQTQENFDLGKVSLK